MAHFAELDENNIVTSVQVVNNEVILVNGVESEQAGINFLANIFGHNRWKQTSYNNSFRKRFAGIGFSYDYARDSFIAPKPYPSWVFNETDCTWEAPTSKPTDNKSYNWSELTTSWVEYSDDMTYSTLEA